jgi:hypothetical protein
VAIGSNRDYKRPVRTQSGELRLAGLAASSKSARAAVQFCDPAATIAENMTAFQPVAEECQVTLEAQKRKRAPEFPAGTKEFLPGTRERVEIRTTCMESITSHSPRWDKIACSQNALLWCIQYLKYHFNILILEVPGGGA